MIGSFVIAFLIVIIILGGIMLLMFFDNLLSFIGKVFLFILAFLLIMGMILTIEVIISSPREMLENGEIVPAIAIFILCFLITIGMIDLFIMPIIKTYFQKRSIQNVRRNKIN